MYTSPALAVVVFGQVRPDVIILDWIFGQEDLGMQLLQRLKLRPSTVSIPVLVCTAAVRQVQYVASFLQSKDVAVIFKPFTVDELLSAITTALQRDNSATAPSADEAFFDRLARVTPSAPRRGGQG